MQALIRSSKLIRMVTSCNVRLISACIDGQRVQQHVKFSQDGGDDETLLTITLASLLSALSARRFVGGGGRGGIIQSAQA